MNRTFVKAGTALTILTAATTAAIAAAPPPTPADIAVMQEGSGYKLKTSGTSMALYTFDHDADGKSNCIDACAKAWPPVLASANAKPVGDWTLIPRSEGQQWAYRKSPVYTFVRDTDSTVTGDGLGGVWHVLKP